MALVVDATNSRLHLADMTLHLLKLCVGAESVDDLQAWVNERLRQRKATDRPVEQVHTTRMVPRRADELMAGGSLYWVIKGGVQVRQKLLLIRPFTGEDGIGRCDLVLEPVLHRTVWQPRRPFQGWRYLKPEDAPEDLSCLGDEAAIPPELARELADLGLL